jgi:hypothetical protein
MHTLFSPEVGSTLAELGCFSWQKAAADGSASTATAETVIGLIGPGNAPIALGRIGVLPAASLTANATNYATITVAKRTAGGSAVTLGTLSTASGSWSAWTEVDFSLSTGAYLSPGDAITVAIAKASAGVGVPQLVLTGFPSVN